ncbi:hypothetical protein VNO77_24393 [Canavalia gladiata]|uniref:Uncharacterized protein n=1 Tax=Canavalia gladiata TaxID=3824 RepID=A0AAN9L7H9_CANGL
MSIDSFEAIVKLGLFLIKLRIIPSKGSSQVRPSNLIFEEDGKLRPKNLAFERGDKLRLKRLAFEEDNNLRLGILASMESSRLRQKNIVFDDTCMISR